MLWQNIEVYVKSYNIYLILKVSVIAYANQLVKSLFMDFLTGFLIAANEKDDSYNSILVIVDWLTKIIYSEPIKVMINISGLRKVIINVVVYHHGVLKPIIITTSKFCLKKMLTST